MRTVGKRIERPITFDASSEALIEGARWNDEMNRAMEQLCGGNPTGFPKGVYRYRSHEEANRHQEECIAAGMARLAEERLREQRRKSTH